MTQKPTYIQLEPNETVVSVRDRLSFLRAKSVLIVWPETGTALTRKLDLVLVQREARRQVIPFALVTHDEQVLQHAKDLGISTFETIKAAEKTRWKRGSPRIFTRRYQKPDNEPDHEELIEVASRVRNQHHVSPLRMMALRIAVLAIVLAVFGGTGYLLIPSAQITIYPRSETLQVASTITLDTALSDVDVESGMIPATVLRANVQDVGTIPVSGTQQSADTVAIGLVIFTNQTDDPVTVPADTVVSTSTDEPIRFKTVSEEIIPAGAGQQLEVAIEAMPEAAGERGNVAEGLINTIEGDLASQLSVINFTPTTGGESRAFSAVTQADREQLLAQMRAQVQATAYTQMQANLNPGQQLVIESIRIPDTGISVLQYSHEVNALTDTLSLTISATVEAIAIDDRFVCQVVFAQLSAQKPPDLLLQTDTFACERNTDLERLADGRVAFTATGTAQAAADPDPDTLKTAITGMTINDARQYLAQAVASVPGQSSQITISPQGFEQLPLLPSRITIQVQQS